MLVVVAAVNVMLDIPFYIFAIPVLITLWRVPLFILRFSEVYCDSPVSVSPVRLTPPFPLCYTRQTSTREEVCALPSSCCGWWMCLV